MKRIIKKIVIKVLSIVHKRKNIFVIFQNDEDKSLFIDNKIICGDQAYKIKGSGIDLNVFRFVPEPDDAVITILFTARMLRDKGVFELAEAAALLKDEYEKKIRFLFCGDADNNPKSLARTELEKISDGDYIKWLGYRTDVRELLEQCHIFAFPSYYREGLPKSLIEACAAGRPIVTTDSVGCRDAVVDGYNGFLIPIKNSRILAEKLKILIEDKPLRILMGKNSRMIAERDFSLQDVIKTHVEIYRRFF